MCVPSFTASKQHFRAAAAVLGLVLVGATPAQAGPLASIKESGHIKLGYVAGARPFSFKNESGKPDGYTVALCQQIANSIAQQLAMPGLTKDWKEVDFDRRLDAVERGDVDILCTPLSVTLDRREEVSFSIPVFAGGNRAAVRADAPAALRSVLSETSGQRPIWRGSPAANVLNKTRVAVVADTTSEKWIEERRSTLQLDTQVRSVPSYHQALEALLKGEIDMVFGERVLMLGELGKMDRTARENVVILDRLFTQEPAALPLARNDDDFRLLVDRALSTIYAAPEFGQLYSKWSGEFDAKTRAFFTWNTVGR